MLEPEERRVAVVANPAAGRGGASDVAPRLRAALEGRVGGVAVRWTEPDADSAVQAAQAAKRGCTHVVAVGGDGTVSGCTDALAGGDVVLAVVPVGTGNDFARAVGATADVGRVADAVAAGSTRAVDVGRLGDRRFANVLGLGLDGAVARRVDGYRRFRLGAYAWGAVREAVGFDPFPLTMETPEGRVEGTTLLAGVANGPDVGGGFRLAPGASVDDGLLDAYRFGAVGVLSRLRYLPRVRRGTHGSLDVVSQRPVTSVAFVLDEPVPAHLDGEPRLLEPGRHEVHVEPGALQVAVPPDGA